MRPLAFLDLEVYRNYTEMIDSSRPFGWFNPSRGREYLPPRGTSALINRYAALAGVVALPVVCGEKAQSEHWRRVQRHLGIEETYRCGRAAAEAIEVPRARRGLLI